MAQAPPLDPPLYSLGWLMRYTISLVVKLNEDLNFLLCCAIDVGECEPFYVTVLSTRSRMYKMILKL